MLTLPVKPFLNFMYFQAETLLRLFHLEHYLLYGSEQMLKNRRSAQNDKAKALSFYRQFIQPGALCFDIGANLGNRTEVFLELGATVVAVEPQPLCHKIYPLKFKRFIEQQRLHLVPKGIGAQVGIAELMTPKHCRSMVISTFSQEWLDKQPPSGYDWEKRPVEMTTLDALITEFGVPAFCKIDTEGFEAQVLAGLSQPLPALSFEHNYRTPECLEKLSQLGTYQFNYSPGESMTLVSQPWVSSKDAMPLISQAVSQHQTYGDVYCVLEG